MTTRLQRLYETRRIIRDSLEESRAYRTGFNILRIIDYLYLKVRYRIIQAEIKRSRRRDIHLSDIERVKNRGYRVYVGGFDAERWYKMGKKQFHYLVSKGLKSNHKFVDIGCGALRLGQYLIPYLNQNNYFGVDISKELMSEGLTKELFYDIVAINKPKLICTDQFDFSDVHNFDYAFAQSLFTHLNPKDIETCMYNLSKVANRESVFYFTAFVNEHNSGEDYGRRSHSNLKWSYSVDTLTEISQKAGWKIKSIGSWNHEANQTIFEAILAS